MLSGRPCCWVVLVKVIVGCAHITCCHPCPFHTNSTLAITTCALLPTRYMAQIHTRTAWPSTLVSPHHMPHPFSYFTPYLPRHKNNHPSRRCYLGGAVITNYFLVQQFIMSHHSLSLFRLDSTAESAAYHICLHLPACISMATCHFQMVALSVDLFWHLPSTVLVIVKLALCKK